MHDLYDARGVAAILAVTPRQVRRLARIYRVGRPLAGRWAFTGRDIEILRRRRPRGRPRRRQE